MSLLSSALLILLFLVVQDTHSHPLQEEEDVHNHNSTQNKTMVKDWGCISCNSSDCISCIDNSSIRSHPNITDSTISPTQLHDEPLPDLPDTDNNDNSRSTTKDQEEPVLKTIVYYFGCIVLFFDLYYPTCSLPCRMCSVEKNNDFHHHDKNIHWKKCIQNAIYFLIHT